MGYVQKRLTSRRACLRFACARASLSIERITRDFTEQDGSDYGLKSGAKVKKCPGERPGQCLKVVLSFSKHSQTSQNRQHEPARQTLVEHTCQTAQINYVHPAKSLANSQASEGLVNFAQATDRDLGAGAPGTVHLTKNCLDGHA